jgi:hypothetical protein
MTTPSVDLTNDPTPVPATQEKLYKSYVDSVKYIFKAGKVAYFIRGRFSTAFPSEIAELDAEIAGGHPTIYFDPEEPTATAMAESLMAGLKARYYQEFLADIAAKTQDPSRDMGESEQGKLVPANTQTIAPVAAGGMNSTAARVLPVMKAPS